MKRHLNILVITMLVGCLFISTTIFAKGKTDISGKSFEIDGITYMADITPFYERDEILPEVAQIDNWAYVEKIPAQEEVVIPETVEIEGETFAVTMICTKAAYQNDKLVSITLPDTVYEIQESAFEGCATLKTVKNGDLAGFSKYMKNIGARAFADCVSLEALNKPRKVDFYVEDSAFEGCTLFSWIESETEILSLEHTWKYTYAGLKKGEYAAIQAIILGKDSKLTWTSSNPEVAVPIELEPEKQPENKAYRYAYVKGLKAGKTAITVTAENGSSAKCTVVVKDPQIVLSLAKLDKKPQITVKKGKSKTIYLEEVPARKGLDLKKQTKKQKKIAVAKLTEDANGSTILKITGKKPGKVTLVVKSKTWGISRKIKVTVK